MNTHLEKKNCYQSLGIRAELLSEGGIGENRINVLKYINRNTSKNESYAVEILKNKDTNLLIAEGSLVYYKSTPNSPSDITLSQYGNKEIGVVSGFIRGQVTGESLIMTEVNGSGLLRLNSRSSLLEIKQYQQSRFSIINTNVHYIEAILGNFDIANPQKIKTNPSIIYSEITLNDALIVMETEDLYEINVTPDNAININPNSIVCWTGNLLLDTSNSEMFRFSGSGQVYLSIAE